MISHSRPFDKLVAWTGLLGAFGLVVTITVLT